MLTAIITVGLGVAAIWYGKRVESGKTNYRPK